MSYLTPALARPLLITKLFWIRANRVLAWSLIASPLLQWALGMRFGTGMLIDFGILVAHAALSLALFGTPETKARVFSAGMHLFGFRPAGLSARNRYLLSGYRIGAGLLAFILLFLPLRLFALPLLYPLLRLPISVIQHMYVAMVYAMRRWGLRDSADGVAVFIIIAYAVVSIINMVR